jgi:hypothetical protein
MDRIEEKKPIKKKEKRLKLLGVVGPSTRV